MNGMGSERGRQKEKTEPSRSQQEWQRRVSGYSKSHAYKERAPLSFFESQYSRRTPTFFFGHIFGVIYQNKTALPVENSINVTNRLGEVGDNSHFCFGNTPKL